MIANARGSMRTHTIYIKEKGNIRTHRTYTF